MKHRKRMCPHSWNVYLKGGIYKSVLRELGHSSVLRRLSNMYNALSLSPNTGKNKNPNPRIYVYRYKAKGTAGEK